MIQRESHGDDILIFDGEREVYVKRNVLLEEMEVDGIIRIQKDDFQSISFPYTHFNLEHTGHQVGKTYALMKIIRSGHYSQQEEVLPLLDKSSYIKVVCTKAHNFISYDEIDSYLIEYGSNFPKEHIKEVILKRYSQSLPNVTQQQIIKAGVALTKLAKI